VYACALSMHQKYSNHTLTNLLFGLCKSVLIIDPLVTHPRPHVETSTRPFTPKVLLVKESIPSHFSCNVFIFGFAFESLKECEGVSIYVIERLEDYKYFSFTT
jgi:hypothetical protein